jgi:hypothetical protein
MDKEHGTDNNEFLGFDDDLDELDLDPLCESLGLMPPQPGIDNSSTDNDTIAEESSDEDAGDSAGGFDYEKDKLLWKRQQRANEQAKVMPAPPQPADSGRRLFSDIIPITVSATPVYPKVNFLCKDLGLAVGPPALLIGISQSGKTFFAQALALCVATGRPLFGTTHSVARGPVVHLDYEQGGVLSSLRYHRLIRGMNLVPGDLGPNDLELCRESVKLDTEAAKDQLCEKLDGKALCIVDSLRASISAEKDENASGIRETIDMLGRVSEETQCTILILHHQGKGTVADDRFSGRGSSAIFEAAGSAYNLEVLTGNAPDCVYRLWQTKTRMGRAKEVRYRLKDVGAHIEEINCTEGIALIPEDAVPDQTVEDKIVAALRQKALTAEELSKAVGGRKANVVKARKTLETDGIVDSRPRSGAKAIEYFLTELGQAYG